MISTNHLAYLESVAAVLLDETKRMKGDEKRQYRRAYVDCRRKLDALKAEQSNVNQVHLNSIKTIDHV